MTSPSEHRITLDVIWLRMVELAEEANDLVVASQAKADPEAASQIFTVSAALNTLARTIVVLADASDAK